MKANELLFLLSARREGSWAQFRGAVEELHSGDGEAIAEENDGVPLYQRLRLDLERLAHVEFFACGCREGWRIVPPTLAAQSVSGGVRGVLCGARSPALRERVFHASEKNTCESIDCLTAPDVIRLVGPDASVLADMATRAGLHFQPDAPLAILSHLPPCGFPSRNSAQTELPLGADWHIREFDMSVLRWRQTDRRHVQAVNTGLFEFQLYRERKHILRWSGGTFKLPRAIALYALLRRGRQDVLCYNPHAAILSLPAICRPPRLLERALVLCSGLPPKYDTATARLAYMDVPLEIARFAAELLRQRLVEDEHE